MDNTIGDIAIPLGVILGVGAAVLILVAVIVVIIWRNRRITTRYSKLLEETNGGHTELNEFEEETTAK